jgi:hypothetical protein
VEESGVFLFRHHHSTMAVHINVSPGDEQYGRWWPQFRDVVSPHRRDCHSDSGNERGLIARLSRNIYVCFVCPLASRYLFLTLRVLWRTFNNVLVIHCEIFF